MLAIGAYTQVEETTKIFQDSSVSSSASLCISLPGFTAFMTPGPSPAPLFLVPSSKDTQCCRFSQCIIHFLAGNAVLIRINIWVLFTSLQSARIARGIQLHKLSDGKSMTNWEEGAWGSKQTVHNPCLKTQSCCFIATDPKVVGGGTRSLSRVPSLTTKLNN